MSGREATHVDHIFLGLLAMAGLYAFLRLMGYGRPENFLQHLIVFKIRSLSGGRFSSAVRAPSPRFPFGPYLFRDEPRRR